MLPPCCCRGFGPLEVGLLVTRIDKGLGFRGPIKLQFLLVVFHAILWSLIPKLFARICQALGVPKAGGPKYGSKKLQRLSGQPEGNPLKETCI